MNTMKAILFPLGFDTTLVALTIITLACMALVTILIIKAWVSDYLAARKAKKALRQVKAARKARAIEKAMIPADICWDSREAHRAAQHLHLKG